MREWCECVPKRSIMPDCCPHCGLLLATVRDNHVPRCHRAVLSDTKGDAQ